MRKPVTWDDPCASGAAHVRPTPAARLALAVTERGADGGTGVGVGTGVGDSVGVGLGVGLGLAVAVAETVGDGVGGGAKVPAFGSTRSPWRSSASTMSAQPSPVTSP